ncbi:MAG: DUF3800 domain-containing protein [Patescibacteria group bacterium]|nr:DUF3800 domain-containing protein [Patescibacteria group bacterium]
MLFITFGKIYSGKENKVKKSLGWKKLDYEKYMLVFIDESGIHKEMEHSTFVLVYIETENYGEIEKRILAVENQLKIDYFHWAKAVWKVKEKFMDAVLGLDFKVKIAIIKNPINPAQELERVLIHMVVERNIRNIYIDGKKPKWYERKIKKILRDKGISVRKLRTVKSSQYAGIRLADMVAGLSRSYFDKRNLERISNYYQRLKKKIIVIIE